ncbi:hypothetical protein SAMN05445756_0877 [Kytococcus aerolatus]|uniref:ABC-2 family transporter protein n=1 Tax=Kytococcus aerolatus TaxID=592308 RepID=A0A212TB59_9MICO|nr:ABC transporter permease [Kytococcus aerolatus]SNC63297.1 hypothetical protein SAMN05445756_0877 [Kytococcus aerolatus]
MALVLSAPGLTGAPCPPAHSTHLAATERVDRRSPWSAALRTAILSAVLVALVMLAFLWPTVTSTPQGLPVAVVGTPQQVDQVTQAMGQRAAESGEELPFELERADSRAVAVQRIEERELYGALVLPATPGDRVEVLTASAANASVAQMLHSAGSGLATGSAQQAAARAPEAQRAQILQRALAGPQVTDVVPLSPDDPRGAGLAVASLPLTIGGLLGGVLLSNRLRGTWRRMVGVLSYAALGGLLMVAVLDWWFNLLPAPSLPLWGAISLSLLATVALIVGLHSAIGAPGIAVGALLTMLLGNPISGAQAPAEFLPGAWGAVGQLFVPGATGTLVRDIAYFPQAPALVPWLTLAGWVALGLGLIAVGHHRTGGHGRVLVEAR